MCSVGEFHEVWKFKDVVSQQLTTDMDSLFYASAILTSLMLQIAAQLNKSLLWVREAILG